MRKLLVVAMIALGLAGVMATGFVQLSFAEGPGKQCNNGKC